MRYIIEEDSSSTRDAIIAWAGGAVREEPSKDVRLRIATLEGEMIASVGDWIIRGVKGEFYPCKPDVFAASYELADP